MRIHHCATHVFFIPDTSLDQTEMEYLCLVQHKVFSQTVWGRGVMYLLPQEREPATHAVYHLLKRRETIQYYLERLGLSQSREMVLRVNTESN